MATLSERVQQLLSQNPGLSDREITDALLGQDAPQQPVNRICRTLTKQGHLVRRKRADGLIGNYLAENFVTPTAVLQKAPMVSEIQLSEDFLKAKLQTWLVADGWHVQIAWAKAHGIDIEARTENRRWIIEVKGQGSRAAMRVNYFLAILGETLQRMDDGNAKYSIALPDAPQFRNLWKRLPDLAKTRTTITALFVDAQGHVAELA